jgi:hypothetical protein
LSPTGQIPVYYHEGTTGQWVKNTATNYPVKYDANGPQYNLLTGGTWTTPYVSPNGQTKYFAVWILATNQIDDPIISIMGQRVDSNQGSAESNNSWSDVNLTNLPLSEVKPLYRLIFAGDSDYTNVPKCALLSILDIRVSVISTIAGVTQNDHGNLFGLGDDDHSQYLHVDNARTVNAIHNFANGINLPIGVYDSFIKAPTNPTASVNFYLPNDLGVSDLTFATTSNKISDFASCTSSQLATKISDETGSGRLVFNNSPTLSGIVSVSGNITINGTGVSISGHTHTSSNITDFNSSVSGLLPVGTANYLSKFGTGGSGLSNSLIFDNGTNVGIGTASPSTSLHVVGSGIVSGDMTIGGNLIVNGTTTTVNVDTVTIEDPIITLGLSSGNVVPNLTHDRGLALVRGTGLTAFMGWDTSESEFILLSSGVPGANSGTYTPGTYGNLRSNEIFCTGINLTPIGKVLWGENNGVNTLYLKSNDGAQLTMYDNIDINTDGVIRMYSDTVLHLNIGADGVTAYSGLSINNQTASTIASFNANKQIVSLSTGTYPSLTELSYVKGVTSAVQTQLNNKQATLTNPVTGTGTTGKIPKWNSTSGLTDSILSESSTVINIAGSLNGQSDDSYLSFDANTRRIGMTKKVGFTGKFTYGSGSSFAIAQSNSGTIEATNTFTDRLVVNSSGNVGIGTSSPTYKLQVNGNFGATTKSFRIDHPSKEGYSLEYGSLESPYHGVRLTGRGTVIKGVGMVSLPSYLKDLIHDDDTLNIQITNIKHSKTIYIDKIDLKNDQFIVKVDRAKTLGNLEFFWTLSGVRKDVDHLVVEKEN